MKKIILSVTGVAVSLALLIASAYLAESNTVSPAAAAALTAVSVLLVLVSVFYAVKTDYETGVYECRNCGHTFKPAFKAYFWGAHTIKTRCLKCPKCEEKTWCIRKSASK